MATLYIDRHQPEEIVLTLESGKGENVLRQHIEKWTLEQACDEEQLINWVKDNMVQMMRQEIEVSEVTTIEMPACHVCGDHGVYKEGVPCADCAADALQEPRFDGGYPDER